jgi:hypothetical protein
VGLMQWAVRSVSSIANGPWGNGILPVVPGKSRKMQGGGKETQTERDTASGMDDSCKHCWVRWIFTGIYYVGWSIVQQCG